MRKVLGHPEHVYIKKVEPVLVENYVLASGKFTGGMIKKDWFYWKAYESFKRRFLDLHQQVSDEQLANKSVRAFLWEEYVEARTDFWTAHEILTADYEKGVSARDLELMSSPVPPSSPRAQGQRIS